MKTICRDVVLIFLNHAVTSLTFYLGVIQMRGSFKLAKRQSITGSEVTSYAGGSVVRSNV